MTDRTVVVGAHLDSVLEGPGINDNGSGSATILEVAVQMAELKHPAAQQGPLRVLGRRGVRSDRLAVLRRAQLTKREIKDIAVNLNFDMVGSPNYVRFVYDGDASDTDSLGSTGSGVVEDVFTDYFASQGLASEPTAFDGRSDYDAFINVGIPAGGLFTGAEDIKTAEEAETYGGVAGVAYDPCYHQACDSFNPVADGADPAAYAAIEAAYEPRRHARRQPQHPGPGRDVGRDRPRHADFRPDHLRGHRHGSGLGNPGILGRQVPRIAPAKVIPHRA